MTDDEINQAIARIEGWHPNLSDHLHACWWFRGGERHGGGPPPYATDWAWCGPLVEKYKIYLECNRGWYAQVDAYYNLPGTHHDYDPPMKQDTPQRAICLAVIAAQPIPAPVFTYRCIHCDAKKEQESERPIPECWECKWPSDMTLVQKPIPATLPPEAPIHDSDRN